MGLLSLAGVFPLGFVAWSMGSRDIKEMNAGSMDGTGRRLTQIGRFCGLVAVLPFLLGMFTVLLWGALDAWGLLPSHLEFKNVVDSLLN